LERKRAQIDDGVERINMALRKLGVERDGEAASVTFAVDAEKQCIRVADAKCNQRTRVEPANRRERAVGTRRDRALPICKQEKSGLRRGAQSFDPGAVSTRESLPVERGRRAQCGPNVTRAGRQARLLPFPVDDLLSRRDRLPTNHA
jgi:hypothetical protein